ncbi:MAG: glycosyl hydrolase family 8 [Ruminococcus sp.]
MKILRKITAVIVSASALITSIFSVLPAAEVNAVNVNALSEETVNFYDYWKEKYLTQNTYVTDETQYYVFYGDKTYTEAGSEVPVTVSEAHGYGMLIAASMAKYDSETKEIFDGMYRYYRAHLSGIGPNLMAWQQSDNGSAIINSSGADSATDGDMDIAYGLLMADQIWGSEGEINYRQAAVDIINDIMTYEVNQNDWILRLGDWAYTSDKEDKYYSATRSSDFIMQYMPVFAEVSGDKRWLTLYENTYSIINKITDEYGTGILPDFIIKDSKTGEFIPAPANFLESENDGNFYYNACRTPWRISMDYLINGNADAKRFADKINDFIISKTGGDPWEIMAGYTPDGTAVSDWNDLCFNAPFMVSAACGKNTAWHDNVRDMCLDYGEDVYFGDTITMLCLIADDGGWIIPESSNNSVRGDVNADGEFSLSDIVLFQKWLLCVPGTALADRNAGDLCENGKLDIFDLCVMKQELLSEKTKSYVDVSTVEELFPAMRNAQPGDVVRLAGGTYDYTTYQGAQKIDTSAEGTEAAPITLTAADKNDPPVITGTNAENGYVIHITGDYWILENLKITTSQKGIVLDNSNHSIIRNCEVYNIGSEAIAIRDGSSYCTVKDSYIHDTGTITPGYGEGVYIGSAKSVTGFDYKCDGNTVEGCTFRNVAAEHIDVKEYTTDTEIKNCIFYGDGMTGANYAGSFVDIAGNNVNVHDNTGYRNGNANIVAAFELHEQVDGWGYHCTFTDNTLYMDQPYGAVDTSRRMYVVDGWYSDFSVKNNLVDYGEGLIPANSWEYYNSDYVTYLE